MVYINLFPLISYKSFSKKLFTLIKSKLIIKVKGYKDSISEFITLYIIYLK